MKSTATKLALLFASVLLLFTAAGCGLSRGETEVFANWQTPFTVLDGGTIVFAADDGIVWARRRGNRLAASADNGYTWTQKAIFDHTITAVYISGAGYMFVATSQDRWAAEGTGRLYRSADGGATFDMVLNVLSGVPLNWNIASQGNIMFVSEYGYKGHGDNARRVYRSFDYGVTWEIVFEPPPAYDWHNHKTLITQDGVVYQSIGDGDNAQIIRSLDMGETWEVRVQGHHPTSAVVFDDYILWGLDAGRPPGVIRYNRLTGEITQSLALPRPFNGPAYSMVYANGIVYAGFVSYDGYRHPIGIFYSRDRGDSWHLLGQINKIYPRYGIAFSELVVSGDYLFVDTQMHFYENDELHLFRGLMRIALLLGENY